MQEESDSASASQAGPTRRVGRSFLHSARLPCVRGAPDATGWRRGRARL